MLIIGLSVCLRQAYPSYSKCFGIKTGAYPSGTPLECFVLGKSSWHYKETLDWVRKTCQRQTLQIIRNILNLRL